MNVQHVAGKKIGTVMLYALSTCVWCQKTKRLLNDLGVEYDFTDVDLLTDAEGEAAIESIKKYNRAPSFPTLVIDDSKAIVGFQEDAIREVLEK
jgi:glutaredoxin